MTKPTNIGAADDAAARLDCVMDICQAMAASINITLMVLRQNTESEDVAHLVADALERLGLMADRGAQIGMMHRPVSACYADQWVFCGPLVQKLDELSNGGARLEEGKPS